MTKPLTVNELDTVVITVRAGVAEIVSSPRHVKVRVIDFDSAMNGECPVCGAETELSIRRKIQKCLSCGWDESMRDVEDIIEWKP